MRYHDFDIWLDNRTAEGYPLRACCDPHGEARDTSPLDPDAEGFAQMCRRLSEEETDGPSLAEFGSLLYSVLFTARERKLEALFERCRGDFLGRENEGIRLRLRIEPPKIAALPWEFLYSPLSNGFLAASVGTPVIRYIELLQEIRELKIRAPVHILVAAPESGLDAGTEIENLSEALTGLGKQVRTRILSREVTRAAISDALLEEQVHILHFIGHGDFQDDQPRLLLNDGRGGLEPIDHKSFGGLVVNHPPMKLVTLNSCKGAEVSSTHPLVGMASELVRSGLPAVVAMQYAIGDDQAVLFSREFYRALFRGPNRGRIEVAVSYARNSLWRSFPGDRVIGTPVLFSRAPEGVLFDLVTGDPRQDFPRTPGQIDTTDAVIRTREENVEILGSPPEMTAEAAEALRRESAELRSLKLRLRLGKASVRASLLLAPALFSLFWLGVFERLPPGLKIESYTVWLVEKLLTKTFSDHIALVSIGKSTTDRFRRDWNGNWRGDHARLLERLSRAGAKAVVFDISFPKAGEPRALDEEFSRAIRAARQQGTAVLAGLPETSEHAPPPVFAGDFSALGFLCLGQTQGSADIAPLILERGESASRVVPSLALAAVSAYNRWAIEGLDRDAMGVRVKPEGAASQAIRITELDTLSESPRGCSVLGAGDTVASKIIDFTPHPLMQSKERRFAYEDILFWPDPQVAASVKEKIVVIGMEPPSERFDVRRGLGIEKRFGYELHADAMNTLLRGVDIRPAGQALQFAIIFGLSLLGGLLWMRYPDRPRARWRLLLAAAILYLGAATLAYWGLRVLLNTLYPLLALFGSYGVVRRFEWSRMQSERAS